MGEFENKFKGVLPKLHEHYQNDNPVAFLVFKTAERFYLDQQSKIEQLEKEKALQELEINQVSQANQEWQRLNFEKEKRISDALKVLGGASPTMLDKKAIRILRGES